MITIDTKFDTNNTTLRNVQVSFQNLENQMGQLLKTTSEWPQGSPVSNIKANPYEQLKAINFRNGREVEMRTKK